jgi:hypothetical protein
VQYLRARMNQDLISAQSYFVPLLFFNTVFRREEAPL